MNIYPTGTNVEIFEMLGQEYDQPVKAYVVAGPLTAWHSTYAVGQLLLSPVGGLRFSDPVNHQIITVTHDTIVEMVRA